ncbi:hypothetical protein F5Y10DRAFT_286781 [Nemania abortiva]|nr:hypothetical protein F5Y10DRAFT_286781 [Nemania abortiva]
MIMHKLANAFFTMPSGFPARVILFVPATKGLQEYARYFCIRTAMPKYHVASSLALLPFGKNPNDNEDGVGDEDNNRNTRPALRHTQKKPWNYSFFKRKSEFLNLEVRPLIGGVLHFATRGHHFNQALNLINDDPSVRIDRAAFFLATAHHAVALMERILELLDGSITRQRLLDEALLLLVTHDEKHCSYAFRGSPEAFWCLVDHGAQVKVLAKFADRYGLLQSLLCHTLFAGFNTHVEPHVEYLWHFGAARKRRREVMPSSDGDDSGDPTSQQHASCSNTPVSRKL